MKKPFYLFGALLLITLIGGVIFASHQYNLQNAETTSVGRVMAIEDYIKNSISELSPEKASMGGTFYVTSVSAQDGKGTVSYEDGHNAYTADFTYTSEPVHGAYTISTFKIR